MKWFSNVLEKYPRLVDKVASQCMSKPQRRKPTRKATSDTATRAKYPRHSVERALRIPKVILEQNAGKPCTPEQAANMLGVSSAKGPFGVEISSATKYGLLGPVDIHFNAMTAAVRLIMAAKL